MPEKVFSQIGADRPQIIDMLAPKINFNVEEIAHSLGHTIRFHGHSRSPVTVARHTINTILFAQEFGIEAEKYAALHDVHEAFVGDITYPVKKAIEALLYDAYGDEAIDPIGRLEDIFDAEVFLWAGYEPSDDAIRAVEIADRLACAYEVETCWRFAGNENFWGFNHIPSHLPEPRAGSPIDFNLLMQADATGAVTWANTFYRFFRQH